MKTNYLHIDSDGHMHSFTLSQHVNFVLACSLSKYLLFLEKFDFCVFLMICLSNHE